jgi:hypothetical protein
MPFYYAYQRFLCLSERFMSVLCLSANDQKWGILCFSASECLFMIVGPIVRRLMLVRVNQSASSILCFLIDMTKFHPSKKNSEQKNSYVSSYKMSFVGVSFCFPPFWPSQEFSSLGVFGSEKVCSSNVGIGLYEKPKPWLCFPLESHPSLGGPKSEFPLALRDTNIVSFLY